MIDKGQAQCEAKRFAIASDNHDCVTYSFMLSKDVSFQPTSVILLKHNKENKRKSI